MTRTGRRKPGPEPVGSGMLAHHISPRFMIQGSQLRPGQCWLDWNSGRPMHFIEFGRDSCATMGVEIASHRLCIELATRDTHLLSQTLCSFKNGVGK